jgi:hypothetical protein
MLLRKILRFKVSMRVDVNDPCDDATTATQQEHPRVRQIPVLGPISLLGLNGHMRAQKIFVCCTQILCAAHKFVCFFVCRCTQICGHMRVKDKIFPPK